MKLAKKNNYKGIEKIRQYLIQIKLIVIFYRILKLFGKDSLLRKTGWLKSALKGLPIDKDGLPIPWYTYSAIAFLEQKINNKNMTLFEYGSGYSTLWWAQRIAKVISCEHNKHWYDIIKKKLPSNVDYIYHNMNHYAQAIQNYERVDIIVIDGRDRVNCIKNSLSCLRHDGVVIWDNSDLEKYREGYNFLIEKGFKRLDFYGLVPIYPLISCTSIFYRQNNCLDI